MQFMTPGETMAQLRERKGWKRPELARLMGTSTQQIERLEKGQRRFTTDWLDRAALALDVPRVLLLGDESKEMRELFAHSQGAPDITVSDAPPELATQPEGNASRFEYDGASYDRMHEDLPIYGTALGAARLFDGEAVEQTNLNSGETVGYLKRPVMLNGRADVYGLYVHGSSMSPVYAEGATIVAERKRPPRIGDDVVVFLRPQGEDDDGERARAVLVKRLVRRAHNWIELEQFNPPITFRLEATDFVRIDRVMTLGDLLA